MIAAWIFENATALNNAIKQTKIEYKLTTFFDNKIGNHA
jgi:hypothetical protein